MQNIRYLLHHFLKFRIAAATTWRVFETQINIAAWCDSVAKIEELNKKLVETAMTIFVKTHYNKVESTVTLVFYIDNTTIMYIKYIRS